MFVVNYPEPPYINSFTCSLDLIYMNQVTGKLLCSLNIGISWKILRVLWHEDTGTIGKILTKCDNLHNKY